MSAAGARLSKRRQRRRPSKRRRAGGAPPARQPPQRRLTSIRVPVHAHSRAGNERTAEPPF